MTRIFVILIGIYFIGGLIFMWKNLPFIMISVELNKKEDKAITLIIAIIKIIECVLIYPYHIYRKRQFKNKWLKEHENKE